MLRYTQNGYDYISAIFIVILYLISVCSLMDSFMIKKNCMRKAKLGLGLFITFIMLYLSFIFLEVLPSFIIYIIMTIFLSYFLYEAKMGYKVVLSLFSIFIYIALRFIFSFIFVILIDYDIERNDTIPYLLSSFGILIIANIFRKYPLLKHSDSYSLRYMACLSATPLISILIINNLYLVAPQYILVNSFFSIFTVILLFFLNVIVFKIFDFLIIDNNLKKQNALFEQQMKSYAEYIDEQDAANKKIIKDRHDLKNQLIFIKGLLENDNLKNSIASIESLISENTQSNKICGNIVIDSILNSKISIAQKNNIKINYLLEVPTTLPFKETDICILLGNALDNALEASVKNSIDKNIDIFIKYYHKNLVIQIKNCYSESLQKNSLGHFVTTKPKTFYHGFGLKSIMKVVDNYNGIMNINVENNIFDMKIVLLGS